MVSAHAAEIDSIIVTLDTHQKYHIAHAPPLCSGLARTGSRACQARCPHIRSR